MSTPGQSPSMEEGGTKIRRAPRPAPQAPPPQEMPYRPPVQRESAQEMAYRPPVQREVSFQEPIRSPPVVREVEIIEAPTESKKSKGFKKPFFSFGGSTFKMSMLVAVLFVILNSKIVWRQFMKLPFMGSIEPSMIALIINALLTAVVFYIITKFLIN